MTDKHDKLVEMALASGAQYHVTTDPGVWLELDAEALAAFAAAHVASLCAAINALESALRLVLAQRVPPNHGVIGGGMLVAGPGSLAVKVNADGTLSAAAPQAKEQGK